MAEYLIVLTMNRFVHIPIIGTDSNSPNWGILLDRQTANADSQVMVNESAIEGMEPTMILRYVKARQQIDESAKKISSFTQVLATFEQWPDDEIAINPNAIGAVHQLLNLYACDILSALEEFAPIREAESAVENLAEHQQ